MRLPILQRSYRFYSKTYHHPGLSAPLQPRFGSLRLLGFLKAKIAVESEGICECDGHAVHKLSQRRLTVDWLAPLESGCSRKHSKVSSDRLSSYIKATLPVLEIFKMAGYFPDRPRTWFHDAISFMTSSQFTFAVCLTNRSTASSRECNVVLLLSTYSIFLSLKILTAAYVFFVVFSSLLSFLQRVLEGSSYARRDQSS
jgi:hypothetical protein